MIRVTSILWLLVHFSLVICCSGQGTGFSGLTDSVGGDVLVDGVTPVDGAGADADGVGPDWGGADWIPGVDTSGDALSDVHLDAGVDLIGDAGDDLGDVGPDGEADGGGPDESWAPCGEGSPCSGGDQICLLLPGDDAVGVCVDPCVPGGDDCPPSQSCVVPDPDGAPEVGYCFLPAGHLEPCNVSEGLVCDGGRSCLAPMGGGESVCTDFCVPGEALCPDLTSCAPVTEQGVIDGWGACLPIAPLADCAGDLACSAQEVCATPDGSVVPFICLPACETAGAPCSTGGSCMLLDTPSEEQVTACVYYQAAADWCDPIKGWLCDDGLSCLDVDDPTGFGLCAADCAVNLDCAGYEVCVEGLTPNGVPTKGCLSPSLAGAPLPACNDVWPCEGTDVCVEGACVEPCSDGCPASQNCVDGGCVYASPLGHSCAPGWAWLCVGDATCSLDKGSDAGVCVSTCLDDGDCSPEESCFPGPAQGQLCLTAVGFGGACSFGLGTACDDDGYCMFLGSGAAGFCTAACPGIGQGGCPDGPPGTLSDCMLSSGGQTWCAFLCGPFSADCPEGMTCDAAGVCLP